MEVGMSLLLATNAWILDVVFLVILLIGVFGGVAIGFIRGICKIAGTVFSVIVAFFFCTPFCGRMEEWFGVVTLLGNAIGSKTVAYWICIVLSFIVLGLLVRFIAFLLGKFGEAIVEKSKMLSLIDRFLGGLLGFAETFILILIVLALFKWIGIGAVDNFLAQTKIVGPLYFGNWFEWLAGIPLRFIKGGKDAIAL